MPASSQQWCRESRGAGRSSGAAVWGCRQSHCWPRQEPGAQAAPGPAVLLGLELLPRAWGVFSHRFVAVPGLGYSRPCLLSLSSGLSPSKYCDRAQGLEQQLIAIPLVLRAGPAASSPPAAARSLCTRQQGAVEPSLGTAARNVVEVPPATLC